MDLVLLSSLEQHDVVDVEVGDVLVAFKELSDLDSDVVDGDGELVEVDDRGSLDGQRQGKVRGSTSAHVKRECPGLTTVADNDESWRVRG
jgi:hypothetical protein